MTSKHQYPSGGPYYFESAITYRGYQPTGAITKEEADKLAEEGYAYSIAYFNSSRKPIRILKVYQGKTQWDVDIDYDENGKQIVQKHDHPEGEELDQ